MASFSPAPIALFTAGVLAIALAVGVRWRNAPGGGAFFWLMLAVAEWSITSALHWIADTYDAKFTFAQAQYIGIASVAPLWLLFAAGYSGRPWASQRRVVVALWALPIVTVVFALTARAHSALWTAVIVTGAGAAQYVHGWWFWIFTAYTYVLLIAGTVVLIRALRHSPPYRDQLVALLFAASIPWLANALYLSGTLPPGTLDPTPVAYSASGLVIAWTVYRRGLFDLVPVARDQLVDSITDPVLVVDGARRVLDMNSAAQRLVPETPLWIGRAADELFPFLAGTPITDESHGALDAVADGTSYDVRVTRVRSPRGRAVAWLVVLHDVTDQRRAAAEREALVRQKSEFVSTVSHELRTPLFSIRASLQLVLGSVKSTLADGDRKLLTIALSTTERLTRSVADLLDLSAIEAQRFSLSHKLVSVDTLVDDALSEVSQLAREASVYLQKGVPLGPPMLLGDRDRLIHALVNLLSNAISVSPLGSVVSIETHTEADLVCISVRDRGPGISQDVVHRMSERADQLDASLSHGAGGTGLGLAITKVLVEQHGGHLRVDSGPGEGSTFIMCLPRAPEQSADVSPTGGAAKAVLAKPSARAAHVLVADDEEAVRDVLVEALQRRGFRVSAAAHGEEAVQILRTDAVDVAVLDLHMPRLNGDEVIRYVRTHGPRPDLPILVLTGAVDHVESLASLGANTLLAKPTDIRRLLAEVEALLPPPSTSERE